MKLNYILPIAGFSLISCLGADNIYSPYSCGINPGIPACNGCGYSASISYLYWKPYQDNNAWANITSSIDNGLDDFPVGGMYENSHSIKHETKSIKDNWDSGLRIDLGIDMPCYLWSLNVAWSHFNTTEKAIANISTGTNLPTFFNPNFKLPVSPLNIRGKGSALWKVEYNQIDFLVNREFIFGYGVTLSPYIGLTSLMLKESYLITNSSAVSNEFDDDITFDYLTKLSSNFKSFGLKTGLKTRYEIGCGIGLYGDLSLSSTYGDVDSISAIEGTGEFGFGKQLLYDKSSIRENCLRTTLDLVLAFEWRILHDYNDGMMFVRCGWEHHTFFDQNNFIQSNLSNFQDVNSVFFNQRLTGGNLYLYGLTLTIGGNF
ncbi:Lpg1974 family pore-forming outer membrane protein [Chlamydiales bacterium]|nr:Lpg1974 family pore-forming outer membrane protein [Chlamydiales bacterium]